MQVGTVARTDKFKLALIEVAAFTLLLLSYIWGWQGMFPGSLAVIITLSLLLITVSNFILHRDRARELGLRVDNLAASLKEVGAVTIVIGTLLVSGGWILGTLRPVSNWTVSRLPWLLFWAFAQQYALQSFVQTRLREVLRSDEKASVAAASLFAFLHLPNPLLTVATLIMGYLWCQLFQRHPNLFTLMCSHTILAVIMSHSFSRSLTHGMKVGPGYFNF
jgi:hypothetical protein